MTGSLTVIGTSVVLGIKVIVENSVVITMSVVKTSVEVGVSKKVIKVEKSLGCSVTSMNTVVSSGALRDTSRVVEEGV